MYEPFDGAASWPAGRADPAAWLDGLGRLLARLGEEGHEIAAISIGGQSPTTVPLAGGGAEAVGMAVTCRHPAGIGLDRTGQHLAQLDYLRAEMGDEIRGAQIWDWALRRLGAGEMQGLWPTEEPIPGYGDAVAVGAVIGRCAGSLGVASGTPLVSASNDAYMSFWAGGLGTPGRGHDPGGSTGGVGVAVAATDRPPELFGFPSPVAGVEVVGGPVNGHGELLEWWSRVSGRPIAELLALAADVPPGAGGVVVLPYHGGERAPRWEPHLRGEIHGLSFDAGAAEIARAVLEGAAYGLRHIRGGLRGCGRRDGCDVLRRLAGAESSVVFDQGLGTGSGGGGARTGPSNSRPTAARWLPEPRSEWWEGVGAVSMDSWPLVPMSRIEPVPDDAYRAGYERFVALGDAAVARLAGPG